MRVALVCTPSFRLTRPWVTAQLGRHGHAVDDPAVLADVAAAGATGHLLADRWGSAGPPDVVLALGWEAGLAAQVATHGSDTPVLLRLTRAGRHPGTDRHRLETAVARSSAAVLVPSVGEAHRLADCGVPRPALRVLPDAVDRERYPDGGAAVVTTAPRVVFAGSRGQDRAAALAAQLGCETVPVDLDAPDDVVAGRIRCADVAVVADDTEDEVALALRAMSCGVPLVAADHGVLADLVADGVTGLLVAPDELPSALRSLLSQPLLRESMGLAAVDRVRARFDTAVAGEALHRILLEATAPGVAAAS